MPTQEIRDTDWKMFCAKFLELHRGQLMSIFQINAAGNQVEVVRDMPLQNIRYERDACNDHILITLFLEGKREVTHDIIEPIHVKLREENEGTKALQIDAENGSAILRFSSGKISELMKGLETI
jgi:hypothetical protein